MDLYFQDYLPGTKCEILKPYFLEDRNSQLPIKEYMEVNSAIALALDGLGMVNKEVNFSKGKVVAGGSSGDSIWSQDVDFGMIKDYFLHFGQNVKEDFSAPLQSLEKTLIRASSLCVMLAVMFVIFSSVISHQIENKKNQIAGATSKAALELAKNDISTISGRASTYQSLLTEITSPQEPTSTPGKQAVVQKDSVPNLLNRIMFAIPNKVKLTSIKNTTGTHMVIQAEAEKYEQLGYFKAVLTTSEILKNVKSTSGQKSDSVVQVTIEGDLP